MFLEKEKEIIESLEKCQYSVFGGPQNKDRVLEQFGKKLEKFPEYANVVIRQQIMMPIWQTHYMDEPEKLTEKIVSIDHERRLAHDSAIASVNGLNSWCEKLGLQPFASINTADRHEVAKFVGNFIGEVYNIGIGLSFDAIVNNRQNEYDVKTPLKEAFEKGER